MPRWSLLRAATFNVALTASLVASAASPWTFRAWRSDDGLPNNSVTGIVQTPDGYLWVGTYSCLARFDGVRFQSYFPHDFEGVDTSKITALQRGHDGSLWIGSLHGPVVHLTAKSVRVFTDGLPEKQVQAIVEDREGSIWISYNHSETGTVYRIRDGLVSAFAKAEGIPPEALQPCALSTDGQGRLWLAKEGYVDLFREGRFENILRLPDVPARLAPAAGGGLWICSGPRLLHYDEATGVQEVTILPATHAETQPTALLEDRAGGVWIGTSDSGLYHFKGGSAETVPTSDVEISSLAEDGDGHFWVGTGNGGLNLVTPRVVTLETTDNGLPSNALRSLCEDGRGTVWATTQNDQLVRRRDGVWATVPLTYRDLPLAAFAVTADPQGTVWIGSRNQALVRLRDGQQRTWGKKEGLIGRDIRGLLVDRAGDLWITENTPDNLQRLHGERLETIPLNSDAHLLRAMAQDREGTIWLGATNGTLLAVRGGIVADETPHTTGAPLSIRSLLATDDGSLWIAYADEGLGWLKAGRFVHFATAQGFPEASLSQLVDDGRGWLWFAGDHGIFKARRQSLEDFGTGHAGPVTFVKYARSEGLFSLEGGFGASPGAFRSHDGRLWMPMRTALAVVEPAARSEDRKPPPVLIDRVAVDDQTVASYGGSVPVRSAIDLLDRAPSLTLRPDHYRIEFRFTALSFDAPENIRFRYRLEGFERDWVSGGPQRSAIYSRLPPGHYRFRVQTSSGEGAWNEESVSVAFAVLPFFWQTWWFQAAAITFFTGGIAAAVRYVSLRRVRREVKLLEQQAALARERARIARDLHDEFGSRLTEMGLIAELDLREASSGRPGKYSAELVEGLRSLERDLDMMIWAVNPKNDSLSHLVSFISRSADEFLKRSDISCRLNIPTDLPAIVLTPELRQHLFLVVREAVKNVVKHSRATAAKLSFALEREVLIFRLEDNGRGFVVAEATASSRNGLHNMRGRIEELGGEFMVSSVPGQGTVVAFHFPLSSHATHPAPALAEAARQLTPLPL